MRQRLLIRARSSVRISDEFRACNPPRPGYRERMEVRGVPVILLLMRFLLAD